MLNESCRPRGSHGDTADNAKAAQQRRDGFDPKRQVLPCKKLEKVEKSDIIRFHALLIAPRKTLPQSCF